MNNATLVSRLPPGRYVLAYGQDGVDLFRAGSQPPLATPEPKQTAETNGSVVAKRLRERYGMPEPAFRRTP